MVHRRQNYKESEESFQVSLVKEPQEEKDFLLRRNGIEK